MRATPQRSSGAQQVVTSRLRRWSPRVAPRWERSAEGSAQLLAHCRLGAAEEIGQHHRHLDQATVLGQHDPGTPPVQSQHLWPAEVGKRS